MESKVEETTTLNDLHHPVGFKIGLVHMPWPQEHQNQNSMSSLFFMTYLEHPTFAWTPEENITYCESDIAAKNKLLQYARQLVMDNSEEARAASKRTYDV